jgi:DNA-binding FadR family transcriptional regulator
LIPTFFPGASTLSSTIVSSRISTRCANVSSRAPVFWRRAQTPALAASAETEFHLAIIAATHNGLFVTIGGAVKTALRVSFALTQRSPSPQPMDLTPYQTVLSAILERRGDEASEAMRGLLELSRQRVLTALDKAPTHSKVE